MKFMHRKCFFPQARHAAKEVRHGRDQDGLAEVLGAQADKAADEIVIALKAEALGSPVSSHQRE
ncbi:hypothetical protein [Caulobacter sp. B11]|uniref:hypothetical protein n=1 Tax=Caulobacter sp. B11 TaxID=2048899 RepID=UPI00117BF328|nr:hypothetical protein [Caulobacter sp. B11]